MSYFSEPYTGIKNKSKAELDLPNYATISNFKSATDINTLQLARKPDLAILKSNVNELDTDELKKNTKRFKQFNKNLMN